MNRAQLIKSGVVKPAPKVQGPVKADRRAAFSRRVEAHVLTPTERARQIIEAAVRRGF